MALEIVKVALSLFVNTLECDKVSMLAAYIPTQTRNKNVVIGNNQVDSSLNVWTDQCLIWRFQS